MSQRTLKKSTMESFNKTNNGLNAIIISKKPNIPIFSAFDEVKLKSDVDTYTLNMKSRDRAHIVDFMTHTANHTTSVRFLRLRNLNECRYNFKNKIKSIRMIY